MPFSNYSLSNDVEKVLNGAMAVASDNKQPSVTAEHLLISLICHPEVKELLGRCTDRVSDLHTSVYNIVSQQNPGKRAETRDIGKSKGEPNTDDLEFILQRAHLQAQTQAQELAPVHLLISLYAERNSLAVKMLNDFGISRWDIINAKSHPNIDLTKKQAAGDVDENYSALPSDRTALEAYCVNENVKATKQVMPVVGRDLEVARGIEILSRMTKNNFIIVGEPGVGKTTIVRGMARRIVEKTVPEALQRMEIYTLDLASMVAGSRYRGDFEERLKAVIREVQALPLGVLFIDEIHTLIGAGDSEGGLDAANMLKPALADGTLRCIGATTFKEYRKYFESDEAMTRRFQKIEASEPDDEKTTSILLGVKSAFEKYHKVTFSDEAIRAAVHLSSRFLSDRRQPDKSIDVIDEAAAAKSFEMSDDDIVDVRHIQRAVAQIRRIPIESVTTSATEKLVNLRTDLGFTIFGQKSALDAVSDAVVIASADLQEEDKPRASMLFHGPSGTGKTDVCKKLAEKLGLELLRFDMSEYMEKHTVSRLVGAPPGYSGHDEGGLLTEAVWKHPNSLVMFDEAEKANPDIFNLLLQVMSEGRLTDSSGKTVDFRDTIIVLTTNAGVEESSKESIGFGRTDDKGDPMEGIRKLLTAELIGRLDSIIEFHHLSHKAVRLIVDKNLSQLEVKLNARQYPVSLEVDEDVRDWLANNGHSKDYGARNLANFIKKHIKLPLSKSMMFEDLVKGGIASFSMVDGTPRMRISHSDTHPKGKVDAAA